MPDAGTESRGFREDVARWLEALQSPESADLPSHPNLLFFRHAGVELAFRAIDVGTVEAVSHTHRVPHRQGEVFRGLAATRGDLVPLGDLSAAIDLPRDGDEPNRVPRLVVLSPADADSWTLIVDVVHGVELSDPDSWRTPEPAMPFVDSIVETPRGDARLLDTAAVIEGLEAVLR